MVDISNPGSPHELGYCATPGDGWGIFVSGSYAYMADGGGGLRVMDIKTPTSPNEVGNYDTPGMSFDIFISGIYAYIANDKGGLRILNISDPSKLYEVGFYDTPGRADDVHVSGNYAYVADGESGLRIIDISNPSSPQEVGFYDTPGYSCGVYVSGKYAYVADYDSGLRIIDVSSPSSPHEKGYFDTQEWTVAYEVYVSENYAYVAAGRTGGLRVIDVSNPNSPQEVGFYDTPGSVRGVYVSENYVYVADGFEGLRVIDLPKEIGYFNTQGYAIDIYVSDNYAYVADNYWGRAGLEVGLRVLDVATPSSPQESAFFRETLEYASGVHVSGEYIFVTNFFCGMTILKHETTPPAIAINREQLNFGYEIGGNLPGSQTFSISNSGGGTLNWTVSDNADWLNCSPSSGTNSGGVTVSIDPTGLSPGTYTGSIRVEDTNASNSPQTVDVTLEGYSSGSTSAPFGTFETPVHGSNVQSSVPVTGWVLDDIEVDSVKIYRANGKNLVYIGDGLFVEGARPDIEQAYPGYPNNYKAGWGYMMLTNFLPNGGNGTYSFHAIAADIEGHQVTLGTRIVTIDNANAVKPFGAIDTPAQGGSASGSDFRNQGWVLTPMPNSIPTDGSTINVIVDGVNLGHPTYNIYRSDIATLFPGYANSDGALAYFDFDTTTYSNGVHTIAWTAADDAGNSDGIGSRYFSIQNSHGERSMGHGVGLFSPGVVPNVSNIPIDYSTPVRVKKGFNRKVKPFESYPDDNGIITIETNELQRLEIRLFPVGAGGLAPLFSAPLLGCTGYQVVGPQLRPLPIGFTLDTERGVFYWQPGPGFIGGYGFVFIKKGPNGELSRRDIIIKITPKFTVEK